MNGAKHRIQILLVDDHPVVRKGVRSFLAHRPNLNIVGEASNGAEAIRMVRELSPEVVLMDIQMPEMDGLTATEYLHDAFPRVKVLVLSVHRERHYLRRIIKAGACGYVLKDASPDEFVRAIEAVMAGQSYFSPSLAPVAVDIVTKADGSDVLSRLSGREREVLALLADGKSNKQVANALGLGFRTVETLRERIMRKLQTRSVAGLTKIAVAHGLVSLEEEDS
jgi:DNA-binding NarL/FixJ family response regulator